MNLKGTFFLPGIVTRCPLEMQLKNVKSTSNSVSPSVAKLTYEAEETQKVVEVKDLNTLSDHIEKGELIINE